MHRHRKQTNDAPAAVHNRKKYQWRMVTTWLPHFPVMGEGADILAEWIDEMTEERLQIQVYGGGLKLWDELYEPFNLVPFPLSLII